MKQIFRILSMIALVFLSAGQMWAQSNPRVTFVYEENHGTASASAADGSGKVIITVTPVGDYRCIDGDLTAETIISSINAGARTRTSSINYGETIAVTCTKTNEFTLQLPADENEEVRVNVKFSEKLTFTPTVSITDWTYGEAANEPTVGTSNKSGGGVTYTYADTENGTYSTTVPTQAGTHWVKATVAATVDYKACVSAPVKFTISQKTVTVTAEDKSKVYGADDPTLTATVAGTLGEDKVTYTLSRAKGEDVGEYAITASGDASQGNYSVTFVGAKLTITKADGSLTAPTAVSNLVYSGKAQALINAGSSTTGTVKYSLDGNTYSTDIPQGTDAKEYTVYYKLEGDANHNGIDATSLKVSIAPKSVTVTAEDKSKVYGADDPTLTATVAGTLGEDKVIYTLSRAKGEDVGEYAITASGDASQGNYAVTYSGAKLSITAKTVSAPKITLGETSYVYDGQEKKPTVTVKDGDAVIPATEYSVGYTNNVNVGTATVTITDVEGGNYTVSGSATFSIASADGSLVPPAGVNGLTYSGTAQDLITAGSSTTGTMQYSLDGSTYSEDIPQGTDAKEYTVYYKVVAKAGYKDVDPASFKVTIVPKTVDSPTITLSGTSFEYTGEAITPTVVVKDGTTTIPAKEYTVSYKDNTNVGTATVTITDKEGGNYTVSGSATFEIESSEPSVVDEEKPVDVDGQTLYKPTEEVGEAIKETIKADMALPAEAESRVQVTEDGGLKFSMGGNMQIGLLGLKLKDIVKFVFTGKLYGDGSKLCKRNASSSRGTRTAGDLEIISGVEYEVIEAGDQTIIVALEEVETTIETITVSEPADEPDEPTPAESESITISKAKQVPYYSEYNLDFTNKPELKAYVATGYDKAKGTIWLTRVKQVPAETGFLLMGEPGDYDIPVSATAENCYYKNMFKGTLTGTTIQTTEGKYTNYYLSNGKSGVGFYKVTNPDGQSIGANRCYLPILTDIPANGSEGDAEVIKVSAAKQVPYYTSKNVDFTSLDAQGVKAYTATGYNYGTGVIWLTRVKKVPAQTGILVMADKAGEYSVPTTSVQSVYENMFTGSETAQTIYTTETVGDMEYINYYLSNGTSGVGFYKVTNENGQKMGANRSYLQIPKREKASGARGMDGHASFCKMMISDNDDDVIAIPVYGGMGGDDEGTTGIISTQFQNAEQDVYYNLQGQRIDRPRKGLYIRNGRVVVIK